MTACIVGWSHTRFGKLEEENLESLIVRVTREALENAGIEPRHVDAIFVSHMSGGFVPQTFISSLPLQADPGLRFKPATRVENACASGSAAIYQAIDKIEAGNARIVLVVGAEKMTALPTNDAVAKALASASYTTEEADQGLTFPGIFAQIARQYFERYGDKTDVLARIAAKNHANGALNPYAHIRKDLGYEYCRTESARNPMVAPPLKVTDCSTVADGAAALVLADSRTAAGMKTAVAFRSRSHVNDFLPMSRRDMVGATGVSMHVMAAMQLVGEAGDFQVGGVFNMGGSAVANYVSILEPVRA